MTNRLQKTLHTLKAGLRTILSHSPMELAIALFYFVLAILIYENQLSQGPWEGVMTAFPICFGWAFALNRVASGKFRWLYYLAPLGVVLVWWIGLTIESPEYFVALLSTLLLMSLATRRTSNEVFITRTLQLWGDIFLASIFTGVAAGALSVATYATGSMFALDAVFDTNHLIGYYWMAGLFLLMPTLLLLFQQQRTMDDVLRGNRAMEILLYYILTPALLLYGVILYAYFLKIIVLWSLPKGMVSVMAVVFLGGSIVVGGCRFLLDKSRYEWFYRRLPLWSIPALVMLWIALGYRIGQYGYTELRVYLLLGAVTLTGWLAAMALRRGGNYYRLTLGTVVVFVVFTFTPGINVHEIARRSQTGRPQGADTLAEPDVAGESRFFRVSGPLDHVDVSGYRKLYSLEFTYGEMPGRWHWVWFDEENKHEARIFDPRGRVVLELNPEAFVRAQMARAGIDSTYALISDPDTAVCNRMLVYDKDSIRLVFSSMSIDFTKGESRSAQVALDYVLVK